MECYRLESESMRSKFDYLKTAAEYSRSLVKSIHRPFLEHAGLKTDKKQGS